MPRKNTGAITAMAHRMLILSPTMKPMAANTEPASDTSTESERAVLRISGGAT